jgi:7,8-dihydropterin-6-yl-methyl-4-(beta-D-ribofuranosyl)aminobenzene 5'-phosphate synthase
MDVGYSDAFMQNAQRMNIDMDKIGMIVISHGHDDHTEDWSLFSKKRTKQRETHRAHARVQAEG